MPHCLQTALIEKKWCVIPLRMLLFGIGLGMLRIVRSVQGYISSFIERPIKLVCK